MGELESPNTDPNTLAVRVLRITKRQDSLPFSSVPFPAFPKNSHAGGLPAAPALALYPCPFRASAGDLSSMFLREDIPEDKRTKSNYIYTTQT
jgi:hypothetical protein